MNRRFKVKLMIFVLAFLAILGIVNVSGEGYTYDHKGNVIYSTEGFTVNQTPYIYNNIGINDINKFKSPSDLFVYSYDDLGVVDNADFPNGRMIYLLDANGNSGTSILFVLDDSLHLQREVAYLTFNPNTIEDTDLTKVKSAGKALIDANATISADSSFKKPADIDLSTDPENAKTIEFVDALDSENVVTINHCTVDAGGAGQYPESAPKHDGYEFIGWDTEIDNVTDDIVVKAQYKKNYGFNSLEELKANTSVKYYMCGASCVYRGVSTNSYPHTDYLYIADTTNNQVLVVDAQSYDAVNKTYTLVQVITKPTGDISADVSFNPIKCLNDAAGRVYVICNGIQDGILEFSKSGDFDRFVGTNYVTLTAWEIFTRNFATEAQLDKFTQLDNTTFTAMVYKDNMIYATSQGIKASNGVINDKIMIKKINPSGKDVLRRNGYTIPKGDVKYPSTDGYKETISGPSQFNGVTVNEYGVYTLVDKARGRLFTYDNEGNLLYISSNKGDQLDKIKNPVAVQYLGENILVLDAEKRSIIIFEPTDIAKVINKAIQCEYNGITDNDVIYTYNPDGTVASQEEVLGAYHYWKQVIQLNANYEYAYIGIGKHYMNSTDIDNNYKIAMEYFELGADPIYYSKAFKQYRDAIIKQWFPWVVSGLAVIIIGGTVFKKVRRKKLGIVEQEDTGIGDE